MVSADTIALESIAIEMDGYVATITAPADMARLVRATFIDLIRSPVGPRGAEIIVADGASGAEIVVDGRCWDSGGVDAMIDCLTYVLLRASLDADSLRLHLHAGYVSLDGAGVVIAGLPGSGKSTLVALLVEAGFDYLTEERVALDVNGVVTGIAKPVSVVAGSFEHLRRFDPATTGLGSASDRLWHVPATAIRRDCVRARADPRLLVLIEYHHRAPFEMVDVHPAEAVRLLLADSPDAARFGPAGLRLVADFVASMRCVRIRYGEVDHVRRAIEQKLRGAPVACAEVSAVQFAQPTGASTTTIGIGQHVVSPVSGLAGVLVAGRCVVLRLGDGEVIELDETSATWLQLLDGSTPLAEIVREVAYANGLLVPAVREMADSVIEQLRSSGLVQ